MRSKLRRHNRAVPNAEADDLREGLAAAVVGDRNGVLARLDGFGDPVCDLARPIELRGPWHGSLDPLAA